MNKDEKDLPLHFNADTTASYLIYNPRVVAKHEEILHRILQRGLDDAGRDGDVLRLREGDKEWEAFASGMYHAVVLMRLRSSLVRSLYEAEPADLGPTTPNPLENLHKAFDATAVQERPVHRVRRYGPDSCT